MKTEEHLKMLGLPAKDLVTGLKGVVTTVSFDLYGCIQVVLTPEADKEGKTPNGQWMDVTRIKTTGKKPVMELPDFEKGYVADGKKGCAEKPLP